MISSISIIAEVWPCKEVWKLHHEIGIIEFTNAFFSMLQGIYISFTFRDKNVCVPMIPKVKSTTTPLPHKSNWKIPPNKTGLIAQSSSIKQTNFGITITSHQIPWCEWHVKVHFLTTENLCEKGTLSLQVFKMKMPRWLSIFWWWAKEHFYCFTIAFHYCCFSFRAISYIFHHGTYLKEVKAFTNKWMGLNIESNKQERNSFVKQRELKPKGWILRL
jgi:hypothetical protein